MRGMVADDPNDQTATDAAFELLHTALALRLALGRLTVVDATNIEGWAREKLMAEARRQRRPAVAVVFDLPLAVCLDRNAARTDRRVPSATIRRQHARMRASLPELGNEGFSQVVTLTSPEEVEAVLVRRVA
jgi:protein phosphatase